MNLSSKSRNQLFFIAVLLVGTFFWISSKKVKPKFNGSVRTTSLATSANQTSFYLQLEEESRSIDVDRDPFVAAVAPSRRRSGGLILDGILYEGEDSTAVINDRVVKMGQEINGYRVETITQLSVILTKDHKIIVLELD